MPEIKALTSLRGIFALWVLGFHLGVWSPLTGWDRLPILSRGYLAVDFFFVLSGFILARAHGGDFRRPFDPIAYLQFIVKRAGRLFPLHWAVLIAISGGLVIFGDPLPWHAYAIREALLVHRWNLFTTPFSAINGPDWSISTEWAANLLFPLFIVCGMQRAVSAILMGAACVVAIIFVAWRHGWTMDVGTARNWLPLIRCFGEFGIGVLLARQPASRWLARDLVIGCLALGLVGTVIFKVDLASITLLILLLSALTLDAGRIARALSARPVHWLGQVSYSIYLIQLPTLILVRKVARLFPTAMGPIYLIGTGAIVLAVSWASYNLVEKNGVRASRRLLAMLLGPQG